MAGVAQTGAPIAFKVAQPGVQVAPCGDGVQLITAARALGGMQKEALVHVAPGGTCWRMLCDEGPYLNGTDLAPFPLAFFSAGVASCCLSRILELAHLHGVHLEAIELIQDCRYGMEGSAIRGTMVGSAMPIELEVRVRTAAAHSRLERIVADAIATSRAEALMRASLASEFTLMRNGRHLPVKRVKPWQAAAPAGFAGLFARREPANPADYATGIITRLEAAQTLHGVEGGAGSSLQADQKRTLHVRATCGLRADGLRQIKVQLLKPIGSVFQFLSDSAADAGGSERAPDGLAYLSAGIAFCYLTQIGRYAHIVRQRLDEYGVIQQTQFSAQRPGAADAAAPRAAPVRTHVLLESPEDEDRIQELVRMAEQTCFLHAACRTPLPTRFALACLD